MDEFYLNNTARYQALVTGFKTLSVAPTAKVATEMTSLDMVVSARIRPLPSEDAVAGFSCAIFPRSAQTGVVDIHDLYNHPRGRPTLKSFNYQVDRLFHSQTTTEEIYENLVANLVPFVWNGGIGTLFAYGQTGSGKTFTVSRLEQLVAESLMDGKLVGPKKVYITIIELSGNSAYDLLNSHKPISILEDSFGDIQLAGADDHLVQSKDEIMVLIERAASFRRTESTLKNDASSRSHSICRFRIRDQSTSASTKPESDGLLYLIDLAGSEGARDVATHGADRMRETREINMSLSVLKDCIRGKAQSDALKFSVGLKSKQVTKQRKPHIPFRQSTLTKILKHVFDPTGSRACKTVVIACVNPSLADVGPSKNTLRYAEMLRILVPKTDQIEVPMDWTNTQLKDWISKNSGTPPISSAILAPTESGAQLLCLPAAEIEIRCLKNPGVGFEQAKAIRSKLWKMHIDSQRVSDTLIAPASSSSQSTEPHTILGHLSPTSKLSSRDLDPISTSLPFKKRIRAGMIVSWNQPPELAVVLCPIEGVRGTVKDVFGNVVIHTERETTDIKDGSTGRDGRYLCALVMPGLMAEAYELNLWQQTVVDVAMMDKEVILEYDAGTRYYYVSRE